MNNFLKCLGALMACFVGFILLGLVLMAAGYKPRESEPPTSLEVAEIPGPSTKPAVERDKGAPMPAAAMQEARSEIEEKKAQICDNETRETIDRVFGIRDVAKGYVIANLLIWPRYHAQQRETALEVTSVCLFDGGSFEVRHPQTGRVLATWSWWSGFEARE